MKKKVKVGNLFIGGDASVTIQSMLNIGINNVEGAVNQALELQEAGCEIIRLAVPNLETIPLISALKNRVNTPLVADIHFDYKLAIEAVSAGIDKVRINPGNIGDDSRVKAVIEACQKGNVPIRIGVNSGSVEKNILAKHGKVTAAAMVESADYHIKLLEKYDFNDIVLSLKCSDVSLMLESYRLAFEKFEYPLHLGVTEAGTARMGLIKSSIGIGSLLADGIGDTIRVSLTANPVEEIAAAKDILKASGRGRGAVVISCPTCGRTEIDLIGLANKVEKAIEHIDKDIKIAVMGCVVNGPGEAKEADCGVAGGKGVGVLFRKGEVVKTVPENELLDALMKLIEEI